MVWLLCFLSLTSLNRLESLHYQIYAGVCFLCLSLSLQLKDTESCMYYDGSTDGLAHPVCMNQSLPCHNSLLRDFKLCTKYQLCKPYFCQCYHFKQWLGLRSSRTEYFNAFWVLGKTFYWDCNIYKKKIINHLLNTVCKLEEHQIHIYSYFAGNSYQQTKVSEGKICIFSLPSLNVILFDSVIWQFIPIISPPTEEIGCYQIIKQHLCCCMM